MPVNDGQYYNKQIKKGERYRLHNGCATFPSGSFHQQNFALVNEVTSPQKIYDLYVWLLHLAREPYLSAGLHQICVAQLCRERRRLLSPINGDHTL